MQCCNGINTTLMENACSMNRGIPSLLKTIPIWWIFSQTDLWTSVLTSLQQGWLLWFRTGTKFQGCITILFFILFFSFSLVFCSLVCGSLYSDSESNLNEVKMARHQKRQWKAQKSRQIRSRGEKRKMWIQCAEIIFNGILLLGYWRTTTEKVCE